ncbi:hypothetical protein XELAEV_18041744mg [Xenopus laevis]|uniref:Uncharacterized protein n=1 Tax=Xenopus laevis TaxID=8355 RepID=A0A974H5U3_XENLA|nr:hypothetical protein XELAEV_18041744mg [Xenopus laevis]
MTPLIFCRPRPEPLWPRHKSGPGPGSEGLSNLLMLELEGINFHDGNVNPLSFKPLKKLIYLRPDHNQFRAIPTGLPASLQQVLHLGNNHIEIVSERVLNKTLNLSILVLSNNVLQEHRTAPWLGSDLLNLELLYLSHNQLVMRMGPHVPFFLPRGLKQLIMHHNQIKWIPVSEDSSLVSVYLENNFINHWLILPATFFCIKTYHSVVSRPQHGEYEYY